MFKKWFLIGFLCIYALLNAEKQIIRLQEPSKEAVEHIFKNHYDVAGYQPDSFIDIVASDLEFKELLAAGFDFTISKTVGQVKQDLQGTKDIEGYRSYDDVLLELLEYQGMYPDLCKLYNLGSSQGYEYSDAGNSAYDEYAHSIWALKVSDNVEIEEDEPGFYYMGAHHAREPISTEVVMTVLGHLMDNYGSDTEITNQIDNSQIWLIPIVNPDGHKVVLSEIDIWWRKNIRDNNENGVFNTDNYYGNGADGVDPNRNYGWQWATGGASGNPSDATYYGPSAFSEPEIVAMQELMAAHHFVAGISYHSHSELVLFPFGYADGIEAPDKAALQNLAISMAETIPAVNTESGHYIPIPSWELYPASGTTDDYAYGEHGIFSYTIELGVEFIPPANQVEGICNDNIEAAKILLNRINHSTLTGHVMDSVTREPLVAEIFIHEIDDQGVFRKPYLSNDTFGRYYRMAAEGLYDVTFSAFGYESVTIEDVVINSAGQTVLDMQLFPASQYAVEGLVQDNVSNNPIENVTVQLYYALNEEPVLSVETDSNGYFSLESIPSGEYELVFRHVDYATYIETIMVENDVNTIIDLFEPATFSFENNELNDFDFAGNSPWILDTSTYYEGNHSVRSGTIGSWQNSTLVLDVDLNHAGEISFFKKVSSEADYDFFHFKIDGELIGQWSGEIAWSEEIYFIEAGEHTFEWMYEKDGYVDEGNDCAWIDLIQLPPLAGDDNFYPPQNLIGYVNYDTPNPTDNTMLIEWESPLAGDATLGSYGIYRNYELIETVDVETQTFSEVNPPIYQESEVHYYVVANYSNPEGNSEPSNIVVLGYQTDSEVTDVNFATELKGNYPNPFNPNTTLYFSLQKPDKVELTIYNIKGQLVKSFKKENLQAGNHQIEWNGIDQKGSKIASGIFFYQMKTKEYQSIKKMVMLK